MLFFQEEYVFENQLSSIQSDFGTFWGQSILVSKLTPTCFGLLWGCLVMGLCWWIETLGKNSSVQHQCDFSKHRRNEERSCSGTSNFLSSILVKLDRSFLHIKYVGYSPKLDWWPLIDAQKIGLILWLGRKASRVSFGVIILFYSIHTQR